MAYFDYNGKKVYYAVSGTGKPCLFLHGNTASSKMFEPILPLYTDSFQTICIDFAGNGRSERLAAFPDALWMDQGRQVIALCRHLNLSKAFLIGTSGGAYAAINAALEAPEYFEKIVADSFDGSTLPEGFANAIIVEREKAKADPMARGFYAWCQGDDWERVIKEDTRVLVNYDRQKIQLFHRPIEQIAIPLFITVSREDTMLANDMVVECQRLNHCNPKISYQIYQKGAHPLILSQAESMAAQIIKFFHNA